MGHAEILFDQIRAARDIEALRDEFETEKLHLDFKGRVPDALAAGWDNVRDHLAKALSGFSNADGGVLILGVGEARGAAVRPLEPYDRGNVLSQKILEQVSRVTDPPVPGVLSKVVWSDEATQAGFVVVLIPKSDSGPHQHAKEKKYYQRAGESHVPMAHFQVADLFGRRPQPNLEIEIKFYRDVNHKDCIAFTLQVRNLGAGISKYPFIVVEGMGAFRKRDHFTPWLPADQFLRRAGAYSGGIEKVIHTGTSVPILQGFATLDHIAGGGLTEAAKRTIKGELGCEGMATKQVSVEIPIETLMRYRDEAAIVPEPLLSSTD